MKRILWMAFLTFFHLPRLAFWLFRMAAHPERYTIEQRYALLHRISVYGIKNGRVDLVSTGVENLPEQDGYILYPNHQGLFDIMALVYLHERPLSAVLKIELTKIPFLKQMITVMGGIPLDRSDPRQAVRVVQQVADEVKEGRNFLVFAEGTRSHEGNKLLDFKGGSFKSATKARCPIVPVALIDSFKIMDTNTLKRTTVQVHFLDPIPYEAYEGMKTVEIAAMVKEKIEAKIASCKESEAQQGGETSRSGENIKK